MSDADDADKTGNPGEPGPAVAIPAELAEAYRKLATSAEILGKGLEGLAHGAMMLGLPDPAAAMPSTGVAEPDAAVEGAAGFGWPELENVGTALRGWAVLVVGSLPAPEPESSLIVVKRGLQHP